MRVVASDGPPILLFVLEGLLLFAHAFVAGSAALPHLLCDSNGPAPDEQMKCPSALVFHNHLFHYLQLP